MNFFQLKKGVDVPETIGELQSQLKDAQNRIKELEKYQLEWDKIKRSYAEEIKQNFNEIEQLKLIIQQKDKELNQTTQDISKTQSLKLALDSKAEEIERLEKLLEEWQAENQQLSNGIQALQLQLESEKDQIEKVSKKYKEEFRKLRQETSKEDITQLKYFKEQNEKLKSQNSQLSLKIEELTINNEILLQEKKDLQNEIQLLQNKIKQEQTYANSVIDKRIITNILIQYLDFSTEFKVKIQILETLSSLLDLTEEEKEKISPYRNKQNQSQSSISPLQQQSSFKDKFIGFLINGE